MLNIPETVKALFKQDGVNKNFRAHFPGGELPDITNDDIVEESVKFQESVCSQNVFRFGLTEASVIEFETVGVGNMYGMTMECSSEIDCSRLTAAELAEIQAGTWDGELVLPAASGLAVPVFRVPLGTYRVESCPRDHQAMAHRRVTAYTLGNVEMSPIEKAKLKLGVRNSIKGDYSVDLTLLVLSQLAWNSPQILDKFQKTVYAAWSSFPVATFPIITGRVPESGSRFPRITVEVYGKHLEFGTQIPAAAMYQLQMQEINVTDLQDQVSDYIDQHPEGSMPDYKDAFLACISETVHGSLNGVFSFTSSIPIFYPEWPGGITLSVPENVKVTLEWVDSFGDYPKAVFNASLFTEEPALYVFDAGAAAMRATFEPTNTQKEYGTTYRYYTDCYDLEDLTNGVLEILAMFSAASRSGGLDLIHLSDASPEAIIPGQYRQMWFDEFAVEPIGTIRYAYTDEADEEQIVDYVIGSGASVYDMTDNAALKAMTGATPEVIESILDTSFVPYLGPVNFVPIDLSMKGLPYIEAGDALAVTAQDGTVCSSYALRRELGGVQALTDQIDSQSGLIIDSEEGA